MIARRPEDEGESTHNVHISCQQPRYLGKSNIPRVLSLLEKAQDVLTECLLARDMLRARASSQVFLKTRVPDLPFLSYYPEVPDFPTFQDV